MASRLTDKLLASLAVPAGERDIMVGDLTVRGLLVRVTASGSKSFVVRATDRAGRKIREPDLP